MTWLWLAALAAAPDFDLEVPTTCEGIDAAQVKSALAVELESAAPLAPGNAAVTCEGGRVRIVAGTLEREIDLSIVAIEARSRTLALAIAELIILSIQPAPQTQQAPPRPERPTLRLLAEGTAHWMGRGLFLFGGGLRWCWERPEPFGLEIDARFEHGAVTLAAGTVLAERATLGVAGHARWSRERFTLRGIAGLRGGGVRLSGRAARPESSREGSGFGAWLGLTLGIAGSLALGPLSLELGLDAGIPIAGPVALVDGAKAAALNGFSAGARLGVGIFP